MNGLAPMLLVAVASWLIRLTFIIFVPAQRLPERVTAALAHVTPAVLGALVSVQTAETVRGSTWVCALALLGCLAVIAAVAYRRPNLTLAAGLGVASVLFVDLALAR